MPSRVRRISMPPSSVRARLKLYKYVYVLRRRSGMRRDIQLRYGREAIDESREGTSANQPKNR